ncbi:MAG: cupin domain-containing protein [Treponema sp.]|jgi:quercetin dioxygenase-like cupin family protein|nr:cupin domain-containing protein [Treponema sp.]
MFIVDEKDKDYRFGDSGPKYLIKGPRMNFSIVRFMPGQDFRAHYHNVMEENFYVIEGEVAIVIDGVVRHLSEGQFIHIEPREVHYLVNQSNAPVKLAATMAPFQESDKVEVDNPIF